MDNSRILELEHQKQKLEEYKTNIINNNRKIKENISEKNKIHYNAKEYQKYKNNTPLAIGVITFAAINFFASRMFDYSIIDALLVSILPSAALTTSLQTYFTHKKEKYKNECPKIDLEQYNIEENEKQIDHLFEQSFLLTDEIQNITTQIEENIQRQESEKNFGEIITEEKPKVKVMTLTRKK